MQRNEVHSMLRAHSESGHRMNCIMKLTRWLGLMMAIVTLFVIGAGCGGEAPRPPDPAEQATAKVEALKKLADAMAHDANGAEARGELENFRNTPFDPQKHPKQAEELVEVYRHRIQGKYRGFVAQEIAAEVGPLQSRLKPTK